METQIIIALIAGAATVIAAAIAILPKILRRELVSPEPRSASPAADASSSSAAARIVYFRGAQYRILNFGGKNCRIEAMEGGQSFLAPTHELVHDPEQTRRITRDSIVVRV